MIDVIPYGRHSIDETDIAAVVRTLRSDWLTTGPEVDAFETALAGESGGGYVTAVSSGTAALHAVMHAGGIGPGDEVIVPAMTFAATANSAVYMGARPVFADVCADTLLLDPSVVEEKITPQTRAVIAVDYAGQPCDYDALRDIADRHDLQLIADACHALGAEYKGRKVGTLADFTTFSFHPVKHVTTGEGGAVVTANRQGAAKIRAFRNHGINADHRQRHERQTWFYEMEELGFNYRISDIQCALGRSQLTKLQDWLARRRRIARLYDTAFAGVPAIKPLRRRSDVLHAYHLYVVNWRLEQLTVGREEIFRFMRRAGIGVNVHYIPVHLHPFYQKRFGCGPGDCPVAERAYERIVSLPIFPGLTDDEVARVIDVACRAVEKYGRRKD